MRLEAVIFDWAGTTVDFGCMAPAGVFRKVFEEKGVDITMKEAREPMGLHKKDHIRKITNMPRVRNAWKEKTGYEPKESDVEHLFNAFIPAQLSILHEHCDLVPGIKEVLKEIREMKMKIGSTTGYNNEMMDIVTQKAAEQGFQTDTLVCATDVSAGRPAPWMAFKNAELLNIYPMKKILKVGDTLADISEGVNAGMWSVGVIDSGNEMGYSRDDFKRLSEEQLTLKRNQISKKFMDAGAHFVIYNMNELPDLIQKINNEMEIPG